MVRRVKPLANGRIRDPYCACNHGPAVHTDDGACKLRKSCGCTGWTPVPYEYVTEPCQRCAALHREVHALRARIERIQQALAAPPPKPHQQQRPRVRIPEQRSRVGHPYDELFRARVQARTGVDPAPREPVR
ncbi:hypothetical protein SAMN05443637_1289 [Pseudonocardia thermophila]|jgi:hypothetical protein|uniref:Uncharacterized protein n=1 Tax=Pseudonocardia thermophila TaxID=1848 RepID=A0A1M7AHI4_PSETH|nr:hypothetical protein [Pseudonocardia thermophila]SHL42191.1 hypothetical protein SAMN05443637_1289 [Pseudonocardia thermophila]